MSLIRNLQQARAIRVHDGRFHFDDVLAVALLRCAGCAAPVIRGRNLPGDDTQEITLFVDVGRLCDWEWRFDHHQDNAPERTEYYRLGEDAPRTRFCSAGLLWQALGIDLAARVTENEAEAKKVFATLDERLFMWADYRDNGTEWRDAAGSRMSLAEFVNASNGEDVNASEVQDALFESTVAALVPLLRGCINNAAVSVKAENAVRAAFVQATEKDAQYAVLPPYADGRWKKALQDDPELWEKTRNMKAAVIPNTATGQYWAYMLPATRESSFECRCRLDLKLMNEFDEFTFIHHNGFMGVLTRLDRFEKILTALKYAPAFQI